MFVFLFWLGIPVVDYAVKLVIESYMFLSLEILVKT